MTLYQLIYLISPEVSEDEVKKFSAKIADFVKQEQGEIKKIKEPFIQKLGYPIKKQISAYMVSFDFNLEKEKLPVIEEKLNQESRILRYAISKKKIRKKEEKTPRKKLFSKEITKIEPLIKPTQKDKTKIAEKIKNEGKVELKEIEKKLAEILE